MDLQRLWWATEPSNEPPLRPAKKATARWLPLAVSPIYASRLLPSRLALVTPGWPLASVQPGEGKMPSSRLSVALSEFSKSRWAGEPSSEPPLHPTELDLIRSVRSSRVKRALLAVTGFLLAICIGIGATLAWQSYGDKVRGMIANLSPQFAWLAPQAVPVADAVPAPSASASPEQLVAISRSLAAVRQSVDKLAADVTRLQAARPDTPSPDIRVSRTSAPPPPAVGAPGRKPVPPMPPSQA